MGPHMSLKRDRGKPPPTPLEKSRRAALATFPVQGTGPDAGLEYVLLADRIETWRGEHMVATHPLGDIRMVQLGFDPSEPRAFYTCTITAAGFEIILRYSFRNTRPDGSFSHFSSSARYEDFVRKLLGQLADVPGVRFRTGSGMEFILFAFFAPVFLGVAVLGFVFREIALTLAGVEIAIAACWMFLGFRPRSFDPRNPPERALPSLRAHRR
jgi:hypothetical protein